jgi:F-type H+-transporting ATPase subunit b
MSALAAAVVHIGALPMAEDIPYDGKGYTTVNPILPPTGELIIGSLASIIVFAALYKFAGPVIRDFFKDRTSRVQRELEESAAAKSDAEAEAERIRQAKGDIDSERTRLYAEADEEAEALLAQGRERIDTEMAELERRADAEIEAAASRSGDELSAEIVRYSSAAIERVVKNTLDDAAQQELIEGFIARVGVGS